MFARRYITCDVDKAAQQFFASLERTAVQYFIIIIIIIIETIIEFCKRGLPVRLPTLKHRTYRSYP